MAQEILLIKEHALNGHFLCFVQNLSFHISGTFAWHTFNSLSALLRLVLKACVRHSSTMLSPPLSGSLLLGPVGSLGDLLPKETWAEC